MFALQNSARLVLRARGQAARRAPRLRMNYLPRCPSPLFTDGIGQVVEGDGLPYLNGDSQLRMILDAKWRHE